MKVLFLPAYYYPETAASSYLGDNLREAICAQGYEIELHAPAPSRGLSADERKKYKKIGLETFHDEMMTVHRFSMFAEGKNPVMRALRYVICWIKHLKRGANAKDIDCIFLASTPPIQGLLGAFLKKYKKIPFVYNLQDIFPDSLVGTGLVKKGSLLWKIGRLIENFTYKHADKIIVISEDFKKNIIAKGVPEDKIVVVYNWVDQNAVVDIPRDKNKLTERYNLDPKMFYIEYSGNIGLTQNMDLLLEVMGELKETHPSIALVLVGEGAYKSQVEKIVTDKFLTNVTMIPFQPYEDISHVFSLGDVGLVISKPGVGENSVPSKTWSIMSASRPVLANFDENELKTIIADNECGVFTKAGDKETFKNAIIMLYQNREKAQQMGLNGREFVMKNLTKEVGTQKYVDVIKEVVKNNK